MRFRRAWQAVKCAEEAVKLGGPTLWVAHKLRGSALDELGERAAAEEAWQESLRLNDRQEDLRHVLQAMRGHEMQSCSIQYVEQLFDHYAERFDDHLSDTLKYRGPEILRNVLDCFLGASSAERAPGIFASNQVSVLDLGCGTGLSGLPFRDIAKRLVGVDISSQMLAKARTRGIYDDLRTAEVVAALADFSSAGDVFQLVVVADVLVYFGALEGVLMAISKILENPGGVTVLSIEVLGEDEGVPYRLQTSGRFRHAMSYVRESARLANFEVSLAERKTLRIENGGDVPSAVFLLVSSPAR